MGARNVLAAFDLYAGLVPPTSMLLLLRMAVVARDGDANPWYAEGHEALARMALGRGRHAVVDEADLRAVERAITPLRKVGAIHTDRPASVRKGGHNTARYRLNLDAHAPRNSSGVEPPSRPTENVGREAPQDPQRPPKSGADAPRKVVRTPHENRGTEEYEETRRRTKERGAPAVGRAVVQPNALATVLNHPSSELAIITDTRPSPVEINAGQLTSAWVDHCRANNVTLPRDLIGRYAKSIKSALDDGFEPGLIKRALGRMLTEGQASWPGSFPAYLVRVQEQPGGAHRKLTPGEESAARLVAGADNPGEVIDAVQRFFERGAS